MAREIFISYSRDDKDLVHPFVIQINQALGIECWIDLKGIESGAKFQRKLMEAIDNCEIVLFMLSDESLASEWTEREVMYAERRGKRIIPVVIDGKGLRGWYDFYFGNVDFIDFRSEEQKEKLVENLRIWLGLKKKISEAKAPQKVNEEAIKEGIKMRHEAQAEHEAMMNYLKGNEYYVKGDYEEAVRLYLKAVELGYEDAKYALEKAQQNAEKEAKRKAEEEHQKKLKELENIALEHIKKDGKWGFADKAGNVVIQCKWKVACPFKEELARVQDDNEKYGFIDKTGKVVIPCKWKEAWYFSEGLALVRDDNGKWGFIDKTGKVVIPCKWKSALSFSEGMAAVKDDNGKLGYIDKTGKVVIPCKWEFALSFSEGLAYVKDDNGKYGFIDKTGKVVIPCKWKLAWSFSGGLAKVMDDNGKRWIIDRRGTVVREFN